LLTRALGPCSCCLELLCRHLHPRLSCLAQALQTRARRKWRWRQQPSLRHQPLL
ncbi:hypothetical protein HaLaN_30278, partial [Haematococcus lacustris]